ncbi:membrane integrity-associated transporter subunit PqiC [[Erwinia] mediterraneensis]|uniref:membrane integrity-associated transporter subunit PqiC n=1 Tax=[Erwinia] mediterraneensis TaxID=2161819 RepID=UPI001032613C|nr:membrane integrity-associated transporter subunit PqiC [[Erwinia] mediterraneensis]
MKKWIIALTTLAVSACSNTVETTTYQLPAGSGALSISHSQGAGQPMLWVQQVTVPDYLAGSGVVYQTSDVKYVIASQNVWASPLDQQLQQTLVTNLSRALPDRLVSASPLNEQHDILTVNVTAFHGRYDGKAVISGEWVLQHQGKLIKQPFDLALPQQEDGYDALVRTLAAGWQQQAQQIAQILARPD